MAFFNGMVMLSSTRMSSWIVATLASTIPLWSYAFAVVFARRRLLVAEAAGVAGGIAGIVVLLWPAPQDAIRIDVPLALLLLAGAATWGGISVWEKRLHVPKRPLVATGLAMIFCGAAFTVWSAVAGELRGFSVATFAPSALGALAYLVLVASIAGYGAYMWLLDRRGAIVANSFGYVSPAIAVLLGWAVLHEPVTGRTFAGFALIVVAVGLTVAPHPFGGKPLERRVH